MKNLNLYQVAFEKSSSVSPLVSETKSYVLKTYGLKPDSSESLTDQIFSLMEKARDAGISAHENSGIHPWDEAYEIIREALHESNKESKHLRKIATDPVDEFMNDFTRSSSESSSKHSVKDLYDFMESVYRWNMPGSKANSDPVDHFAAEIYGTGQFKVKPQTKKYEWQDLLKNAVGDWFMYSENYPPSYNDDKAAVVMGETPPSKILLDRLTSRSMEIAGSQSRMEKEHMTGSVEYKKLDDEKVMLFQLRNKLDDQLREAGYYNN